MGAGASKRQSSKTDDGQETASSTTTFYARGNNASNNNNGSGGSQVKYTEGQAPKTRTKHTPTPSESGQPAGVQQPQLGGGGAFNQSTRSGSNSSSQGSLLPPVRSPQGRQHLQQEDLRSSSSGLFGLLFSGGGCLCASSATEPTSGGTRGRSGSNHSSSSSLAAGNNKDSQHLRSPASSHHRGSGGGVRNSSFGRNGSGQAGTSPHHGPGTGGLSTPSSSRSPMMNGADGDNSHDGNNGGRSYYGGEDDADCEPYPYDTGLPFLSEEDRRTVGRINSTRRKQTTLSSDPTSLHHYRMATFGIQDDDAYYVTPPTSPAQQQPQQQARGGGGGGGGEAASASSPASPSGVGISVIIRHPMAPGFPPHASEAQQALLAIQLAQRARVQEINTAPLQPSYQPPPQILFPSAVDDDNDQGDAGGGSIPSYAYMHGLGTRAASVFSPDPAGAAGGLVTGGNTGAGAGGGLVTGGNTGAGGGGLPSPVVSENLNSPPDGGGVTSPPGADATAAVQTTTTTTTMTITTTTTTRSPVARGSGIGALRALLPPNSSPPAESMAVGAEGGEDEAKDMIVFRSLYSPNAEAGAAAAAGRGVNSTLRPPQQQQQQQQQHVQEVGGAGGVPRRRSGAENHQHPSFLPASPQSSFSLGTSSYSLNQSQQFQQIPNMSFHQQLHQTALSAAAAAAAAASGSSGAAPGSVSSSNGVGGGTGSMNGSFFGSFQQGQGASTVVGSQHPALVAAGSTTAVAGPSSAPTTTTVGTPYMVLHGSVYMLKPALKRRRQSSQLSQSQQQQQQGQQGGNSNETTPPLMMSRNGSEAPPAPLQQLQGQQQGLLGPTLLAGIGTAAQSYQPSPLISPTHQQQQEQQGGGGGGGMTFRPMGSFMGSGQPSSEGTAAGAHALGSWAGSRNPLPSVDEPTTSTTGTGPMVARPAAARSDSTATSTSVSVSAVSVESMSILRSLELNGTRSSLNHPAPLSATALSASANNMSSSQPGTHQCSNNNTNLDGGGVSSPPTTTTGGASAGITFVSSPSFSVPTSNAASPSGAQRRNVRFSMDSNSNSGIGQHPNGSSFFGGGGLQAPIAPAGGADLYATAYGGGVFSSGAVAYSSILGIPAPPPQPPQLPSTGSNLLRLATSPTAAARGSNAGGAGGWCAFNPTTNNKGISSGNNGSGGPEQDDDEVAQLRAHGIH